MKKTLALAPLALLFTQPALAEAPLTPEQLEATGQRAFDDLDLIGLQVAVTNAAGDTVMRQFGVIEEGKPAPIEADTLFPIASLSKAFTGAAIALLVEREKLKWDDPLREYIPEFDMGDPYVNAHFTVRDLLTHRSGLGLGAGDLLFMTGGQSQPSDVLKVLKALPPVTSFRQEYAYDNILYILAGELIQRIDGRSWDRFVRDELFVPLDMTRCVALPSERVASGRSITEHGPFPGSDGHDTLNPKMMIWDNAAAAGGIGCSAGELTKWARMWLNQGKTDAGTQLLKQESVKELLTIVTPTGTSIPFGETKQRHISGYALGWDVSDMLGRVVVAHSGGDFGATAYIILSPEEGIGVVALNNSYSSGASSTAIQLMADMLHARPLPANDYLAQAKERWVKARAAIAEIDQTVTTPADAAAPPAPLAAFTGSFTDPWFGQATISQKDGKLWLDLPHGDLLDGPLTPYDGKRFVAIWPERRLVADAFVDFEVTDGKVTGFRMEPVSEATDFSYDFKDLAFVRSAN